MDIVHIFRSTKELGHVYYMLRERLIFFPFWGGKYLVGCGIIFSPIPHFVTTLFPFYPNNRKYRILFPFGFYHY